MAGRGVRTRSARARALSAPDAWSCRWGGAGSSLSSVARNTELSPTLNSVSSIEAAFYLPLRSLSTPTRGKHSECVP